MMLLTREMLEGRRPVVSGFRYSTLVCCFFFLQSVGEEKEAMAASQRQQCAELQGEVGRLKREVKKWKVS